MILQTSNRKYKHGGQVQVSSLVRDFALGRSFPEACGRKFGLPDLISLFFGDELCAPAGRGAGGWGVWGGVQSLALFPGVSGSRWPLKHPRRLQHAPGAGPYGRPVVRSTFLHPLSSVLAPVAV